MSTSHLNAATPPADKPITGAPCSVVELMRRGVRLAKEEYRPVTGFLTLLDDWRGEKSFAVRVAQFKDERGTELLVPLFDPDTFRIDSTGQYMRGRQNDHVDGVTTEWVQVWRVRWTLT